MKNATVMNNMGHAERPFLVRSGNFICLKEESFTYDSYRDLTTEISDEEYEVT